MSTEFERLLSLDYSEQASWWRTPNRYLGCQTPLFLANTGKGDLIFDLLQRTDLKHFDEKSTSKTKDSSNE